MTFYGGNNDQKDEGVFSKIINNFSNNKPKQKKNIYIMHSTGILVNQVKIHYVLFYSISNKNDL